MPTRAKPESIYQLTVTLHGSTPPIWRSIEVDSESTLAELHSILQRVMGWKNSHLHQFEAGHTRYGSIEGGYLDGIRDERKIKLVALLTKPKQKLTYTYDFGDHWQHQIALDKILSPEPGVVYPRCIAGARACPPEDCGGIWGYADMLATLADPNHAEYAELRGWLPPDFDPERFDLVQINQALNGGRRAAPRAPDAAPATNKSGGKTGKAPAPASKLAPKADTAITPPADVPARKPVIRKLSKDAAAPDLPATKPVIRKLSATTPTAASSTDEQAQWRALYAAAQAFERAAPWTRVFEEDIFGIRDPHTGEIGYCCVTGSDGEHRALIIYPGEEGYRSYLALEEAASDEMLRGPMTFLRQRCVSASFETKDMLTPPELAQIKALGIKVKGRNSWPMFQDLTPGYVPVPITLAQVPWLTAMLTQPLVICNAAREDDDILFNDDQPNAIPVWSLQDGAWVMHWETPNIGEPPPAAALTFDAARAARIAKLPRGNPWEIELLLIPSPVQETPEERPSFPQALIIADAKTGEIGPPLLANFSTWQDAAADHLLGAVEGRNSVPREIRVRDPLLLQLFGTIVPGFGSKLRQQTELPHAAKAIESFQAQEVGLYISRG